ncbi:putative MFS monocarboxylate transporter [Hypoxylon sp. NC1633]|nr:putative MFS monocarboxylate transporter [Hypoxylon sp. NC1633]
MSTISPSGGEVKLPFNGTSNLNKHGNQEKLESSLLSRSQWLQILSTFIVFFNTWGILLTSGVFQSYYELSLISNYSSSTIAWISTTCAFLLLASGIITGPLYDYGFYKVLVIGGTCLEVFGLMMLSLSTKYYQLFLCQAVCVGLGAGMAFTPSVAAAAASLPHPGTRAKAMGLMASGSCIGGIVYPIMFRYLIPQIGFAWTVRAIAFVAFALYLLSYLALINHQQPKLAIRRFFDSSAFTDVPFMSLSVASLCSAIGFYIPLLYLPILTQVRIPSVDADLALDLLAILNGASVVGRLLAGFIAAKFGPTETILVSLVLASMLLFCWIAVATVVGTIIWAVFWGMISGILVTLPGAFIPLFCPSLSLLGTRSGMYWSWIGLGMLIGSPIGGALYDIRSVSTDYWRLQVFSGCFMMGASLFTVYPVIHLRRKAKVVADSST